MNNELQDLADLLFPDVKLSITDIENKYPKRNLSENAEVTRMAPSPTGFIHLGNLYSALADERAAHTTGGKFFLRIEDTDEKRKVDGAVEAVIKTLKYFEINFDEGAEIESTSEMSYGPYYQRQRKSIYHVYAKEMVKNGYAYPCFCTEDDLSEIREKQKEIKDNPGYYGKWAKCRDLSYSEVKSKIDNGEKFTLRLKSQGDANNRVVLNDLIMGNVELPENNMDIVLLKSDGIPTYHFAHAVDDHLMKTTIVLRGCEWLPSYPIHHELFKLLNFDMPKYAHTAQLMKMDDGKKRKLSKRKDPELSLEYYISLGYYPKAVKVYLLTILNSNFEQWYIENRDKDINEYPFSVSNMGNSGALFDLMKLDDISKDVLSELTPDQILAFYQSWAKEYKKDEYDIIFSDLGKLKKIIELNMGLYENRTRKDFINASQMHTMFSMYYDELRDKKYEFTAYPNLLDILCDYKEVYSYDDEADVWFSKVKEIAQKYNYCVKMSEYKKHPENYNGNVGNVAEIIRVAVTNQKNTPDLWNIMKILGCPSVIDRLDAAIDYVKNNI